MGVCDTGWLVEAKTVQNELFSVFLTEKWLEADNTNMIGRIPSLDVIANAFMLTLQLKWFARPRNNNHVWGFVNMKLVEKIPTIRML